MRGPRERTIRFFPPATGFLGRTGVVPPCQANVCRGFVRVWGGRTGVVPGSYRGRTGVPGEMKRRRRRAEKSWGRKIKGDGSENSSTGDQITAFFSIGFPPKIFEGFSRLLKVLVGSGRLLFFARVGGPRGRRPTNYTNYT